MSFTVIKTPVEYVRTLLEKEERSMGPLCFASSFISSIHFSEDSIRRFYAVYKDEHAAACAALIQRRALARQRASRVQRREIYESSAFTKFLANGTVHTQDSAYRSRPSEIENVLTEILRWADELNTLHIAITTEVLPVVFTIYSPTETIVDIRTNYLYQKIQGFRIEDLVVTSAFQEEFERLWNSAVAEIQPSDVIDLLNESLAQWRAGDAIDLSKWPQMRHSDRETN